MLLLNGKKTYWSDLSNEKEVPGIWDKLNFKKGGSESLKALKG